MTTSLHCHLRHCYCRDGCPFTDQPAPPIDGNPGMVIVWIIGAFVVGIAVLVVLLV